MRRRLEKVPALTKAERDEIAALAATDEKDVDTGDIPELTAADFARAVRLSSIYKPRKRQITARIDADVLLWLKGKGGRGYQSRLNAILREAMSREAGVSKSETARTGRRSQSARKAMATRKA